MSDITDWEPNFAISPSEQRDDEIKNLKAMVKSLERLHADALNQSKKSYLDTFNCFKADVIVLLKALELCAIASQRHGEIALNHHARDMRLEHLQTIITNAITDFSDRKLTSYNDDF